jgi:hypothetical protein
VRGTGDGNGPEDAATPEEGGPENIFVLNTAGEAVEWIYRQGDFEVRSRRLPK